MTEKPAVILELPSPLLHPRAADALLLAASPLQARAKDLETTVGPIPLVSPDGPAYLAGAG